MVRSAKAGLRPLPRPGAGQANAPGSRRHGNEKTAKRRTSAAASAALALLIAGSARAGELVPAVGWVRSDPSGQAQECIALALRSDVVPPFVKAELATALRDDEVRGDGLRVHVLPVTVSLLIAPVPVLFGQFGAGWYRTTYALELQPAQAEEIHEEFGTHLGAGLRVPLPGPTTVEVQGRHVFMREEPTELTQAPVDNSGWLVLAGLAVTF